MSAGQKAEERRAEEETLPLLPPLFSGLPVAGGADPFARAVDEARRGCDAGLFVYDRAADRLRAAIVFAPDVALREAMAIVPICAVGFQNAFGTLAPPEVAVHLTWPLGIRLNDAACGGFRIAAPHSDAESQPDWLVLGLELPLLPHNPDAPGDTPDRTSLYDEGCTEVHPVALLESWSRHTLVWINRWQDGEISALHAEYSGLLKGLGEELSPADGAPAGKFLGLDEDFCMILQTPDGGTRLLPLTGALETGDAR